MVSGNVWNEIFQIVTVVASGSYVIVLFPESLCFSVFRKISTMIALGSYDQMTEKQGGRK